MGSVGPLMLTIRFLTSREGIDSSNAIGRSAPIGRWAGLKHLERRCTAPAKRTVIDARTRPPRDHVCDFRGAQAPQVKRKARERLGEASDRLARESLRMATVAAHKRPSESVRLRK
jgi:hypothetical protein